MIPGFRIFLLLKIFVDKAALFSSLVAFLKKGEPILRVQLVDIPVRGVQWYIDVNVNFVTPKLLIY